MSDKQYLKAIRESGLFDFRDKKENIYQQCLYMLQRTQSMFKWSGLPDTIPEEYLEIYLQINGFVCIGKDDNGDLYAFYGGLGGKPDAYYNPTTCVVSNPGLDFNKTFNIDEDCIIIKNDSFYMGLLPMFKKYASQLTENELSLNMASINTRIQSAISAGDDSTKESAEKFISDMFEGKYDVIADNAFLESLKTLPLNTTTSTNVLGDLIEYEQYLKASWFNEMGLNANYNMKREALNSAETSINDDILFPLVDSMLKERQAGAEKVNKMFGTDINVELSSSWEDNKKEEEAEIEALNPEAEPEEEESTPEAEPEAEEEEPEEEETEAEEITSEEELKDDLEEIKEDIEEIKEEVEEEGESDE